MLRMIMPNNHSTATRALKQTAASSSAQSQDELLCSLMLTEVHENNNREDQVMLDNYDSGNSSKSSSSDDFNSFSSSVKNEKLLTRSSLDEDEDDYIEDNSSNRKKIEIDLTLVAHDRTINSLLNLEDYYRINSNYFVYVQNEIKPWMRKMLAGWMLEVCKNQDKEEDVFVLAMNILDRFLSVQQIGKRHLQLLGTVCMFIASKLKSSTQFNAETLVIYTANSISIEELLNWEQFVLQKLRWDISAITPFDYIPYLFNKLNLISNTSELKQQLTKFISLCAQEYKFSMLPSSMITSGCLFLTFKYQSACLTKIESEQILLDIHSIINDFIDLECLTQCIEQIDELVKAELKLTSNSETTISTRILSTNTTAINTATTTTATSIVTSSAKILYEIRLNNVELKENRHIDVFVD